MTKTSLEKSTKEKDILHEEYIQSRRNELDSRERRIESDYKEAKITGYVSAAGLVGGLGVIYGKEIYEAIKNFF